MSKQLDTVLRTPCCFLPYIESCYEYTQLEDVNSFRIQHRLKCRYCQRHYIAYLEPDHTGPKPYVGALHLPDFKEHSL